MNDLLVGLFLYVGTDLVLLTHGHTALRSVVTIPRIPPVPAALGREATTAPADLSLSGIQDHHDDGVHGEHARDSNEINKVCQQDHQVKVMHDRGYGESFSLSCAGSSRLAASLAA